MIRAVFDVGECLVDETREYGTWADWLGIPRTAMQILRHSDISITMEVYTHVPSEETMQVLKRLGENLGG